MTDTPPADQPPAAPVPDEVPPPDPAPTDPAPADQTPPSNPAPDSSTVTSPDVPVDVTDGVHEPSDDFEEVTITIKVMKMNYGFEANGYPGVPGDSLAYANGHWFVLKAPDDEEAAE